MKRRTVEDTGIRIRLLDLVAAIARVIDVMNPAVASHHLKVAYLGLRIAQELALPRQKLYELAIAGALHDIGAFSLQERLDLLAFEDSRPGRHCLAGCLLLQGFTPFASIARIIKYHHAPWEAGKGARSNGEDIPIESHILHLADRAAVAFASDRPVLAQVGDVCTAIRRSGSSVFAPELIEALQSLSSRDYIWLELAGGNVEAILKSELKDRHGILNAEDLLGFGRLICRLVDFKSEFTATHSCGVAASAVALAKMKRFCLHDRQLIQLAACLHDIGKLAVPNEILEKPGRLDENEWCIMRSHVFYTHQILEPLEKLGPITSWGALHQERLNGQGYPFGYGADRLTLGARIMAVADVFTALTENRPYRQGMNRRETLETLKRMADCSELDAGLVRLLTRNFDQTNALRESAQRDAVSAYNGFRQALRC